MQKRTTTKRLQNTIKSNLLILQKAEIYNKSTRATEGIPNDKFLEYFDYLCESGIFINAIGWHYEKNYQTGNYRIETGRLNPYSETIITVHLSANDSTNDEKIEQALQLKEMED